MLVEAGDLLEFKVYCHSEGQYSINTLHYAVSTVTGGSVSDTSVLEALDGLFAPILIPCLSVNANYSGASLQIIRPTRRPKKVRTAMEGIGTFDGDVLPRQVAGLVRKATSVASRHGRGRMYVPFPSEECNSEDGFPNIAYKTQLQGVANFVAQAHTVAIGDDEALLVPVVFNRTALTGIEIVSSEVGQYWGTCRRRSDVRGGDRPPF